MNRVFLNKSQSMIEGKLFDIVGGIIIDLVNRQRGLDFGRTDDVWQRARYQRQVLELPNGLFGYEPSGG